MTTPESPPLACSLTAADFRQRIDDTASLAREALTARSPLPGGERLTFAAGPGVLDRLRVFVAAESECCPFLTLDLRPGADELTLDVTGPTEAQPIIEELFA